MHNIKGSDLIREISTWLKIQFYCLELIKLIKHMLGGK